MAATSAQVAKGAALVWNGRKLLEQVNLTGISQSVDTVEVTNHDSDDSFKEYVAGLRDGGELTIDANFIAGDTYGQIAFHTDMQAGTKRDCFLVMPMAIGDALSFSAIAKGFEPSFPADGKFGVTGTIKVTGKPTLLTTQSDGISGLSGIEENAGAALSISPAVAAGTYNYTCSVNTASTWVKLTVTAVSHTIYVRGTSHDSGVQGGEQALGAAGSVTKITIVVYESSEAPRIYTLSVTRAAS